MLKEFKEFAMKGNVVDMAVGIMIGAAFGTIVKSLVADVLMPPLGLLLGKVDFTNIFLIIKAGTTPPPYATLEIAQQSGAITLNFGLFINAIVVFLITAWALFLVVRGMNRLKKPAPVAAITTRECPECLSTIPLKAKRCAYCGSTTPNAEGA